MRARDAALMRAAAETDRRRRLRPVAATVARLSLTPRLARLRSYITTTLSESRADPEFSKLEGYGGRKSLIGSRNKTPKRSLGTDDLLLIILQ